MVSNYKEVFYHPYCSKCEHEEKEETEEPCFDCLNHPVNEWTHVPARYEEKT
jgi:hypothetical protein